MGWAVNTEQSSTHNKGEDDDRRNDSDVRVDKPRNTENHAQVYFSL